MYGELFFSGRFSGKREQAIFGFWNSHIYILKKTVYRLRIYIKNGFLMCFPSILKNTIKQRF